MYYDYAEDIQQCELNGMSQETFHCLHLQLDGVYCVSQQNIQDTSCVYINIPFNNARRVYVPRKIPLTSKDKTKYRIIDGSLVLENGNASTQLFKEGFIQYPFINDNEKYSAGYSFPFLKSPNPYYELRINPKISGRCPGHCAFCHRETSYRQMPKYPYGVVPAKEIVARILAQEGKQALQSVNHISVITELFGDENNYLGFLEEMKTELVKQIGHQISFRACAHDVRSMEGLSHLRSIVDDRKYSFTLETFTHRNEIMSEYKGIPLTRVEEILHKAREVGFESIKLNYIAGIDSIEDFEYYMTKFRNDGIVDMLGLSVFTAFTDLQQQLRHIQGWNAYYYSEMVSIISRLGIALYEPHCFDMGFPEELVEKCIVIENK